MTKSLFVLLLACASAANADIWHNGDLTTYTQASWGGDPGIDSGAALLDASFDTVYGATFGVTVGSFSRFTMSFTDAGSVRAYMPSVGPFAPLNGTVLNPISTSSGAFGGNVLALQFNVDFSDAGFLPGASGIPFGNLILENFTTMPALNGLTVRQFLADENTCLGGGSCLYSVTDLDFDLTLLNVNSSFFDGTPSTFAQQHLVAPVSASPVPEPSSLRLVIAVMLGLGAPYRLSRVIRRRARSRTVL